MNNIFQPSFSLIFLLLVVLLTGCANVKTTLFLHHDFDFEYIETVGVIPFENLSKDQGSAMRVTRIFVGELLSTGSLDIIEPGEVAKVLEKYSMIRAGDLNKEQIIKIGETLNVQGLIIGSVNESSADKIGPSTSPVVTLVVRMVETKNGTTVWAATHTEGGRAFVRSLVGYDSPSKSEVTRKCVSQIIKTLIQ